jgi:pyruvate kinase
MQGVGVHFVAAEPPTRLTAADVVIAVYDSADVVVLMQVRL